MNKSSENDAMERRQTEINLAKLEVKVDNLEDKFVSHTIEEHEDRKEIAAILADIREEQLVFKAFVSKYQSYAGAFMLIGSMLWAGLMLFKDQLLTWFKK